MYNILDFGAVADGKTLATKAIQSAIDACHQNGGGRVLIPAGTYLTGSVFLRSNVELHLAHAARLIASTDLADYNADDAYEQNYGVPFEEWLGKHLIMAIECNNVSLTGTGEIDASGDFFFEEPKFYPYHQWMSGFGWRNGISYAKDKKLLRPGQVVCFIESTNVTVKDITIQNSPSWSLFLHGCVQVNVTGLKVFNTCYFGNTDGIDIDCCQSVTVSDCHIEPGDDCITFRCASQRLKNPRPCEYVTVSNCVLSCEASAFRVGVGYGEIRHIRVSNVTIKKAGTGINYITSYAGRGRAEIEDVNFSNVSLYNVSYPIAIAGDVGSVRRITLENIRAYALAQARLSATGECEISDVTLRNVDLILLRDEEELTERRRQKRGEHMLEAHGVKDLTLRDVHVLASPDQRALWISSFSHTDCEGLSVKDCKLD